MWLPYLLLIGLSAIESTGSSKSTPPPAKEKTDHEAMGRDMGEWEKYIVSGNRAPSLALPQYRRMGGRVF
jgi:hypothetical protein